MAHAEQAEVGRRRLVGFLRLARARGDPAATLTPADRSTKSSATGGGLGRILCLERLERRLPVRVGDRVALVGEELLASNVEDHRLQNAAASVTGDRAGVDVLLDTEDLRVGDDCV